MFFNANDGTHGNELFKLVDVNGAPSGADSTVNMLSAEPIRFKTPTLGFSDSTDTPANLWINAVVTTLPSSAMGNLLLADAPI